ncbi:hypothetical protein SSS_04156 [Sarcoptes scabiei]|uniref:Uncharacterized protein n=1 Tax=Sarcoptes scabiei TaxID=52283 RepID=A0A834REV6_SARSC|nr:hypothetical protein SSS_04156 [Sarcoptes scabiei]
MNFLEENFQYILKDYSIINNQNNLGDTFQNRQIYQKSINIEQRFGNINNNNSSSSSSNAYYCSNVSDANPINNNETSNSLVYFCSQTKLSMYSLEKRVDYHLSRIMKGHRLINFKNSIRNLPDNNRIYECIIEILISSLNLISRKTKIIIEAKNLIDDLLQIGSDRNQFNRKEFLNRLESVRKIAINLEQIVWALNSNKEHVRYLAKVFYIPERYRRSDNNTSAMASAHDGSGDSIILLRISIVRTVQRCQEIIEFCRLLRKQIQQTVIQSFLFHFN